MPEISERRLGEIVNDAVATTVRQMHQTVDMEARNSISAMLQWQQSHDRNCTKRDEDANEQRTRVEDKLDNLAKEMGLLARGLDKKISWAAIWIIACGFIVMLIGIIAFFVAPHFAPGVPHG